MQEHGGGSWQLTYTWWLQASESEHGGEKRERTEADGRKVLVAAEKGTDRTWSWQ